MSLESLLFSDPVTGLLKRGLNVHHLRTEVVAANLANVDTPNFKAKNVDFEKALSTAANQLQGTMPMERTATGHLDAGAGGDIPVEEIETDNADTRVDGNTVNQDAEMQKLAESQMYYEALVTALSRKAKMVRMALEGRV